jgi:hypothetical protein
MNLKFNIKQTQSEDEIIPPNPPLVKGGRGDLQMKSSKLEIKEFLLCILRK